MSFYWAKYGELAVDVQLLACIGGDLDRQALRGLVFHLEYSFKMGEINWLCQLAPRNKQDVAFRPCQIHGI